MFLNLWPSSLAQGKSLMLTSTFDGGMKPRQVRGEQTICCPSFQHTWKTSLLMRMRLRRQGGPGMEEPQSPTPSLCPSEQLGLRRNMRKTALPLVNSSYFTFLYFLIGMNLWALNSWSKESRLIQQTFSEHPWHWRCCVGAAAESTGCTNHRLCLHGAYF